MYDIVFPVGRLNGPREANQHEITGKDAIRIEDILCEERMENIVDSLCLVNYIPNTTIWKDFPLSVQTKQVSSSTDSR